MRNFKIETSLPFPFFQLNEIVTSTEVKKPSGVSYMILVLLKESGKADYNISNLLESFGIPKNLQSIFADELRKLIDDDIIEFVDGGYNPDLFYGYYLSNFRFTERGNKIFAEEQISTGKEKESKVKCYYDVALGQLTLKPDPELDVKTLFDNAFDETFMSKFKCEKNVEDFFNSKKGPSFQVKAAEVITKVELQSIENYVGKYACKFNIDGDSLTVSFDYKSVQMFYDNFYSNAILNKAIALKKKFRLEKSYTAKLSEIDENSLHQIILPSSFREILQRRYSLVLARDGYPINKASMIIQYDKSLDFIFKYADLLTVEGSQIYAYCPLKLELIEPKLGNIYLPLVIVLKPSMGQFAEAMNLYIDTKKEYSYEAFKTIVDICNLTKDYEKAISMLKSYMSNDYGANINVLNEIRPLVLGNNNLLDGYKLVLKENYENYTKNVSEDTIETTLKFTANVLTFLNIKKADALKNIMEVIGKPKKIVKLYETLIKTFNEEMVLSFINPLPDVLRGEKCGTQQLRDLVTFNETIVDLKKITGINNYLKYMFNEDELNKSDFKKLFVSMNKLYKEISIFKPFNSEYFSDIEKYVPIFTRINDNLNILDAALQNPKNVKKELIERKIISGDYQFVLINLAAKLDLLLTQKFNCEGNLANKLNQARKERYIDKGIIESLHLLRENRNALAHPNDRDIEFSSDDLRRWTNEVFEIEEKK